MRGSQNQEGQLGVLLGLGGKDRGGGVAKTQRFLKHMLFVSEDAAHCGWARALGRSAKGCVWEAVPRPVWRAMGTMLPLPEGSR